VIEYGICEVPQSGSPERGILNALRAFGSGLVSPGWGGRKVDQVWVDAGAWGDAVQTYCAEAGNVVWKPTRGLGGGPLDQMRQRAHDVLERKTGHGFEAVTLREPRIVEMHLDADISKRWLHARLMTPVGQSGALTLWGTEARAHMAFSQHLVAEMEVETIVRGKRVVKWETIRRNNHWLDAAALAGSAARFLGITVVEAARTPAARSRWPKCKWVDRRKRR
jgi:hypothetical protein